MVYYPSAPISYAVEVTFACNNRCPGCANVLQPGSQADMTAWRAILDTVAPPEDRRRYAELLRITGGEPTLHREFCRIIEYVDTFGIPHATFSNGRWQQPDRIISVFQQCQHFIGILVSLHGYDAESHQRFIGNIPHAFDETCANIQRAASAGLEVFTNTVLTRYNCEHIEEMVELSQRLGAGHAVFNRYLGNINPLEPTEAQLREAILLIERLQRQGDPCRVGDCVPQCFVKNSSTGPNGGIEHCAISPDGEVRPENLTRYSFGNLFEQSIEEIWQSEKARWYRAQLPEQCLQCLELPRCRGGCRSVTIEYGLEGDRLMREPLGEDAVETLEFDPDWKPVPYFSIREASFGYLLVRYNWSVPVSPEAKPVVDALDGNATLAELHERFGDLALDFIGHLYREGCLGFE